MSDKKGNALFLPFPGQMLTVTASFSRGQSTALSGLKADLAIKDLHSVVDALI